VLKKLKIKFVMINMSIVTIMLIVIFGLIYNFTKHNLETENVNMMKSIAVNPFRPGRPNDPSRELKLPFFTLHLGLNGEMISANGGYYDLSDSHFLDQLIEESFQNRKDTGIISEHNLRYYKMTTPMGTILVFSDISSERNTLHHLVQSFILIGLFSFFLFLGISIFLAGWAVKPVAKAWTQQKRFIADASHELKTPLTVIMTNTELLQTADFTEKECYHFLQSISMMSGQMKQLIEKMLLLAKADNQDITFSINRVDLSRLVFNAALSFEGIFIEKELGLEEDIEENITVFGNEPALQQVIDILLDNAGKYSHPHGNTIISLHSTSYNKCQLRVSNPGEPIPAEDLKKIFQRFYRMDESRSRDGSFGLGLSIAENIVIRHKGKIWAESKNGMNSFIVELRKNV